MTLQVFNKDSIFQWEKTLDGFPSGNKDIFYTPNYYLTYEDHENAEIHCAYFKKNGVEILYPFFKKQIDEFDLGGIYFDIFNAYGYGGAISNSLYLPDEDLKEFNEEFDQWCVENNIISELTRANPLHESQIRDADYLKTRTNVYAEPLKDNNLSKHGKNDVKLARNKGLTIVKDQGLQELETFYELYLKTAERLQMKAYYFFQLSYFQSIKSLLSDFSSLIHIYFEEKVIASALIFYYGKRGAIHLAGSDFEYRNKRPNDLLYFAIIEDAKKHGIETLCLGGGTSTDPNDGLFRFKGKFGRLQKDVHIGKKILNPEKCSELTILWETKYPSLKDKYKSFLQKYRLTELGILCNYFLEDYLYFFTI
jgi:serine/alanine adding enzyme